MTDEEIIRKLITAVAKLEERDAAMDRRIDAFQGEMEKIAHALSHATRTLNAIRNVLIVVVVQLIATGLLESKSLLPFIKGMLGG